MGYVAQAQARTVRIALWGGEEGGVYGSTAYVQQYFAPRTTVVKTPEYDKLDVYFNDEGGSGRFRGVSAGGSPRMAAIFKSCTLKAGMLASRANRGFPDAVKALSLL